MTAGSDRVSADLDGLRAEFGAQVGLGKLIDGAGALGRLAAELPAGPPAGPGEPRRPAGAARIAVLAAATPITAGGGPLRETVAGLLGPGHDLRWSVLGPPDGAVHADEPTVAAALAAARDADCVVTIGSGTITDIGKAAAPAGVPLVAVQTATSVNGYADPFSVLLRDGVKRTTPTRWPDALVIDPLVLAGAPRELNRAGIGDMAAMFTAQADWYLAAAVGAEGPPYAGQVAGLVRPYRERMFTLLADRVNGPAELASLLTLSGLTMGLAGSTAPASGMEHAISHLVEMTGDEAAGNLHGLVVGVASVVAAAAWEHVGDRIAAGALNGPARLPDPALAAGQIGAAVAHLDPSGRMAAECATDYLAKLRLLATRPDPLAMLRGRWEEHDLVLGGLLAGPEQIAAGLRAAGLPATFAELPEPVDAATARWAVANCALQRRRFGVADLAALIGAWTDDDIDAVLARAAAAGQS
jgi:glycerol-1-phosphate dehydrogenase [NAD(P)+]